MSTLSSANVTDVNLVLKERTHMRLCINMLIFTHNLGNWLTDKLILFVMSRPLQLLLMMLSIDDCVLMAVSLLLQQLLLLIRVVDARFLAASSFLLFFLMLRHTHSQLVLLVSWSAMTWRCICMFACATLASCVSYSPSTGWSKK